MKRPALGTLVLEPAVAARHRERPGPKRGTPAMRAAIEAADAVQQALGAGPVGPPWHPGCRVCAAERRGS